MGKKYRGLPAAALPAGNSTSSGTGRPARNAAPTTGRLEWQGGNTHM